MNTRHFREGEMVYMLKGARHGKFDDEYEGPYEILKIDYLLHNVEIKRDKGKYVVHMDRLKRAYEPNLITLQNILEAEENINKNNKNNDSENND